MRSSSSGTRRCVFGAVPAARIAACAVSRGAISRETRPSRQQRIQQRAQAIKIGTNIDGLPFGCSGGMYSAGPQHVAGTGQTRIAEEPRDAEVGEFHPAIRRQKQVPA